jgi:hypothetical protein
MSIEKYEDKEEFLEAFERIRPENFLPEGWSVEKKNRVAALTKPSQVRSTMFSSIPLICKAEKCVFADQCPLQQEGIAPRGFSCPIEMRFVVDVMDNLMKDLEVNPNNFVEASLVRDLVDQEVQYLRKTKFLAKESFMQENIIGIAPDGSPIKKKELHLAVELEDRIHKRKQILLKHLLATREQKVKAGMGHVDQAQWLSGIMHDVQQATIEREKLIRLKTGEVERDEFIEDADVIEEE